MKTSILTLAMSAALALPATGYASDNGNIFQQFLFGSDFSHRAHGETADQQLSDRFVPRRTDGLSDNIDDCASSGCVGAGGGED